MVTPGHENFLTGSWFTVENAGRLRQHIKWVALGGADRALEGRGTWCRGRGGKRVRDRTRGARRGVWDWRGGRPAKGEGRVGACFALSAFSSTSQVAYGCLSLCNQLLHHCLPCAAAAAAAVRCRHLILGQMLEAERRRLQTQAAAAAAAAKEAAAGEAAAGEAGAGPSGASGNVGTTPSPPPAGAGAAVGEEAKVKLPRHLQELQQRLASYEQLPNK